MDYDTTVWLAQQNERAIKGHDVKVELATSPTIQAIIACATNGQAEWLEKFLQTPPTNTEMIAQCQVEILARKLIPDLINQAIQQGEVAEINLLDTDDEIGR